MNHTILIAATSQDAYLHIERLDHNRPFTFTIATALSQASVRGITASDLIITPAAERLPATTRNRIATAVAPCFVTLNRPRRLARIWRQLHGFDVVTEAVAS